MNGASSSSSSSSSEGSHPSDPRQTRSNKRNRNPSAKIIDNREIGGLFSQYLNKANAKEPTQIKRFKSSNFNESDSDSSMSSSSSIISQKQEADLSAQYEMILKKAKQRARARKHWRRLSSLLSMVIRGIALPWSIQWPKPRNSDCVLSSDSLDAASFVFRHSTGNVCHGYDGVELSNYLLTQGSKFVSPYNKVDFSPLDLKRLDSQVAWHHYLKSGGLTSSQQPSVFARRYRPAWRLWERRFKKHMDNVASLKVKFQDDVVLLFSELEDASTLEILNNLRLAHLYFLDCAEFDEHEALKWLVELKGKIIREFEGHDLATLCIAWINALRVDWADMRNVSELGHKPPRPMVKYSCNTRVSLKARLKWMNANLDALE